MTGHQNVFMNEFLHVAKQNEGKVIHFQGYT